MEQDGLTPKQKLIFDALSKDSFFTSTFYFTGGTALSAFYLHHRESEDLDFFSEKQFSHETLILKIGLLAKKHNFTYEFTQIDNINNIFLLHFPDGEELKLDFVYQPYDRLKRGEIIHNFSIDSLTDIAVNKLLTIRQRTAIKDFVDLFFLLKQFSLWDLRTGLEHKYNMETDNFLLALDLDKVKDLNELPRMLKPLTLEELKNFFQDQAKKLAEKSVE